MTEALLKSLWDLVSWAVLLFLIHVGESCVAIPRVGSLESKHSQDSGSIIAQRFNQMIFEKSFFNLSVSPDLSLTQFAFIN